MGWTGDELDFKHAPGLRCHPLPLGRPRRRGLGSNITGAPRSRKWRVRFRLAAGGAVDHVPFSVPPPRGRPTAETDTMPTLTYLAYADERMLWAEDIKHDI